ncbi:hypothetical protein GCK72_017297 [Caenorhabditis remanei]|uniref:Uncharacterized protein n=1 Tax=Caenorhabditis remanei TaxID=31234 RepID=A0A6A5G7D0_CAERE|nr:hypothetical protein GCK72_017297 [Caenorhabditis remanei]KAF1750746.1 hypothetical protein GCK72_017297 [Caenorhabditis remanei]
MRVLSIWFLAISLICLIQCIPISRTSPSAKFRRCLPTDTVTHNDTIIEIPVKADSPVQNENGFTSLKEQEALGKLKEESLEEKLANHQLKREMRRRKQEESDVPCLRTRFFTFCFGIKIN